MLELKIISQALAVGVFIGLTYALVTLGFSLTFGIMRVINFAHGAFVMGGMYLALKTFQDLGMSPYFAVIFAIPIASAVGGAVYRLVFVPASGRPLETQFILGLGLAIFFENAALYLFGADIVAVNIDLSTHRVAVADVGISAAQLIAGCASVFMIAVVAFVIYRTAFGRQVRAVAQDPQAAQMCGIKVHRVNMAAFALGVTTAAIGGVLLIPFTAVSPPIGLAFSLKAFIVLVVAGVGTVPGLLVAGLFLGITESLTAAYLPSAWAQVFELVAVVLLLIVRPQGLFGRETW
ncbi:MAG: branched-chain amino acid ABC transporter permease [Dehalococcoidia bacterium]